MVLAALGFECVITHKSGSVPRPKIQSALELVLRIDGTGRAGTRARPGEQGKEGRGKRGEEGEEEEGGGARQRAQARGRDERERRESEGGEGEEGQELGNDICHWNELN